MLEALQSYAPLVLASLLSLCIIALVRCVVTDDDASDVKASGAPSTAAALASVKKEQTSTRGLTVFYASQKGHARRFAERLAASARAHGVTAVAVNLSGFDTDRLVEHQRAVFVVASYAGGSAVPGTEAFFDELTEMSRDFRVEKTLLASLSYAVFGCARQGSRPPPPLCHAGRRIASRAL